MIYFMTNIKSVIDNNLTYVFTDAHAIRRLSNFYTHTADLDKVDWEVMVSDFWNDTDDDMNKKARRQAEFLIHRRVPISACLGFAVHNNKVKSRVETIMGDAGHSLPIASRPKFYY